MIRLKIVVLVLVLCSPILVRAQVARVEWQRPMISDAAKVSADGTKLIDGTLVSNARDCSGRVTIRAGYETPYLLSPDLSIAITSYDYEGPCNSIAGSELYAFDSVSGTCTMRKRLSGEAERGTFTQDGSVLVLTRWYPQKDITFRDGKTGEIIDSLKLPVESQYLQISAVPNSNLVVAWSATGGKYYWINVPTRKLVDSTDSPNPKGTNSAFFPSSSSGLFAAQTGSGDICVYSAKSHSCYARITPQISLAPDMAFVGDSLIVRSSIGQAQIFDVSDSSAIRVSSLNLGDSLVNFIGISGGSLIFRTPSEVLSHDLRTGVNHHLALRSAGSFDFSNAGDAMFLYGSSLEKVRFTDGTLLASYPAQAGHYRWPYSGFPDQGVQIGPGDTTLISVRYSAASLGEYSLSTGDLIRSFVPAAINGTYIGDAVRIIAGTDLVAGVGDSFPFTTWDRLSSTVTYSGTGKTLGTFSPDGHYLFAGGHITETLTGRNLGAAGEVAALANNLQVRAEFGYAGIGFSYSGLNFRNAEGSLQLLVPRVTRDTDMYACFSPSSRFLASTPSRGDTATLHLWMISDTAIEIPLPALSGKATYIDFSPDSKHLGAILSGGSVAIISLPAAPFGVSHSTSSPGLLVNYDFVANRIDIQGCTESTSLSIFDLRGIAVIHRDRLASGSYALPLSSALAPGLYFVRVGTAGEPPAMLSIIVQ